MFKVVTNLDDLIKAYLVRGIVFMEEQKISYALEIDEYEHESLHILGEIDGEPVARGPHSLQRPVCQARADRRPSGLAGKRLRQTIDPIHDSDGSGQGL